MKTLTGFLFGTALIVLPAVATAQSAPRDLSDLVGARGSSVDGEMARRGYTMVKEMGIAQFWWNRSTRICASVAVDDGRVQSIQSGATSDCGHADEASANELAGVAVGIAAVGLIAALSNHHKDNNSRNTAQYNTEYERGYNDAMYGGQYSRNDSESYHSGYMAGQAEQSNRRYANSVLVRGAPAAAQNACKMRGDEYWGVPGGSTVPVSVFDYGQGNYEVTVASGHRRAYCSVNTAGRVSGFNPN